MKFLSLLFRVALVFLILEAWPVGSASAQSDTLSFLHVSDTHVIFDVERHHPELVTRRKHYGKGIIPLKNLLDSVSSRTNLRFVAITGDMVDFYGAATPEKEVQTRQIEQFAQLINQYPVPVFLNIGNHDIVSYGWDGERMTSSQRIAGKARAAWIHSAPAFAEGTYYSRILNVGSAQYRLIFLDNGYNSAGEFEKTKPPYLDRIQLEWLKEQLQESPDDIEIVLMHIPFGSDAEGSEFHDILSKHATVKLILAGHEHQNRVRQLGPEKKLAQVQTAAFARNPGDWRKIRLTANSILVSFPGKPAEYELTIPVKP